MECTQDLHHQQQLEQQEQEETPATKEELDKIAYKVLGAAMAMRDSRKYGGLHRPDYIEKRIIGLVEEYEVLSKRYWGIK